MHQIDAIDNAYRPRGDKVSARHPDVRTGHWRIGQPHRQQRLDLDTELAGDLHCRLKSCAIGNSQFLGISTAYFLRGQFGFDLRPGSVNQHQFYAQRGQQVQVMGQVKKSPVGDHLATKSNDKNLPTEGVNIRCDRLKPVDKPILC